MKTFTMYPRVSFLSRIERAQLNVMKAKWHCLADQLLKDEQVEMWDTLDLVDTMFATSPYHKDGTRHQKYDA